MLVDPHFFKVLDEIEVDQVDELEMSGEDFLEKFNRPTLASPRLQRMTCEGGRVKDDPPSFVPHKHLFIDQNPEQFDRRKGWLGIVDDDLVLHRETVPIDVDSGADIN